MASITKVAVLALSVVLSLPALAQTASPSATAAAQRGGAYDQQIQQDVDKFLRDNGKLKDVKASVEDGIVTLTGSVDLLKYKEQAAEKIRHRDHVAGVRDQVQVAGKTVPDAQLRDQLANKLRYDRIDMGIVFNNLNVGVNNGVATVQGNVRTGADKSSAIDIVENMPGVKGVVDQINVAPASAFDDDLRVAIARKIYGKLPIYANDPQAPIRIVVENGKVGLFGAVNSQVDKQVAESEARSTPGVFSVTNKLVVASQQAAE
jgi:hyperosmotically inducible periplasmic protein